jgi:transcription initiation factor TFIID subunit 7
VPSDLKITFTDARNAQIAIGNRSLHGILLDLPTLVESFRTVDTTQYVKVADISKMLLCLDLSLGDHFELKQKLTENNYQWPNGLTPPMAGISSKRKSKRPPIEHIEAIEKQVQKLLEADAAADSVSFTVYQGDKVILSSTMAPKEGESPTKSTATTTDLYNMSSEVDDLAAEIELDMEEEEEDEIPPPLPIPSLELEQKIEETHAQAESMTNPLIKARLQDAISSLEAELKEKLSTKKP